MTIISGADVRRLLDSDKRDPSLVLSQGRVTVVSLDELRTGRYSDALFIISRKALDDRLGRREFSELDLDAVAGNLNAAVSNLGG
ncbi:hypothetical protein [Amycolatopsis anabasis]|uniref:hypothetical protein n=1 Tax=Amycolatopsis anabasis TaxID=1840409 RepID=UPI00131D010F|nr:hypothetical protein [Amycolatopsis anabasis]